MTLATILLSTLLSAAPTETMPELTDRVFALAQAQSVLMDSQLSQDTFARTLDAPDGRLVTSDIGWWCSGFFPGTLWQIYDYTSDEEVASLARKHTLKLSSILERPTDHDIGFQIMCSYGNAWRLTGGQEYLPMIEAAADRLAGRFNPVTGTTRSWDGDWTRQWDFPVIIDNMMNLSLLTSASSLFGKPELREIAVTHARTTALHHFRADYSTWHLVDYDSVTGLPRGKQTRQGHSDSSMWARGEAWALYGFTEMYKQTGEGEFLTQAQKIASLLARSLPSDGIPFWDFECSDYKDASAAAIMASAFVQLYEVDGDRAWLSLAEKQLRALAGPHYLAEEGGNGGFLLKHCVGNIPGGSEIDVPLSYADYYFLEALNIYRRATSHPRLLCGERDFAQLRRQVEAGENEPLACVHARILARADADPGTRVERLFDESGKRILHRSREAIERILPAAYAYRFTGERKYLETAEGILNDVCDFVDWNPSHFLDVAEMCTAVGVGYDWLYDDLSPRTRAKAEAAVRKAFEQASEEKYAWFYDSAHNWNQVCNGGLSLAALAMREALDTTAGRIITEAVRTNKPVVEAIYSPDGNYAEGPQYWLYGTVYQALMQSCFDSALGFDFGLSATPGFDRSADYMLYCYGANGEMFDYSDNLPRRMAAFPIWYFAQRFRRPELLCREVEMMRESDFEDNESGRFLTLLALWAAKIPSGEISRPSGHCYVGGGLTPVLIARGDWSGTESDWYLGVKGGAATTNHAHVDAGSFVFDSEGVRWAADPGKVEYAPVEARLKLTGGDFWDVSQDSQRWSVFPLGNEWHNTLTVNGNRHLVKGFAPMTETFCGVSLSAGEQDNEIPSPLSGSIASFGSIEGASSVLPPGGPVYGATVDLSEVIEDLSGAVRTVLSDGTSLLVTDRLSAPAPVSVRWTLVTEAQAMPFIGSSSETSPSALATVSASQTSIGLETSSASSAVSAGMRLEAGGHVRLLTCSVPGCTYSIRESSEAAAMGLTVIDIDFDLPAGETEVYTFLR